MGHGKETPRQKMIGMMYLVLTALLALNVSAEVLNAFILVDESLSKNRENFEKKNQAVYDKFNKAYADPLQKKKLDGLKIPDKLETVKKESQRLVNTMDSLKKVIVLKADGDTTEYTADGKIHPAAIKKKDENNVPSEIMILNEEGLKLKQKIEAYRAKMLDLVGDTSQYKELTSAVNATLYTGSMVSHGEEREVPWETGNFEHLPLAGVTTMLSKMQLDIRNVEADMLAFLEGSIDEGSFKFNKIEAIVSTKSNYILVGETFEAEIFTAAYDSTVEPVIKLKGSENPLPTKDGKGVYKASGTSVGPRTLAGVIEVQHPKTKKIIEYPFSTTYTVGEPALAVSATKMNVFYVGVNNPVEISVSGVPPENVRPSMTGGQLTPSGNGYIVRVGAGMIGQKARICASADVGGQNMNMGCREFRVKAVPPPVAKVAGRTEGTVGRMALRNVSGVEAVLEDFDFELSYTVTQFRVEAVINGVPKIANSNGSRLSGQQKAIINAVPAGGTVIFSGIRAQGAGRTVSLAPVVLTVR